MPEMQVRSISPAELDDAGRVCGDSDLGILYRNQAIILSLEGRFVESEVFSRSL